MKRIKSMLLCIAMVSTLLSGCGASTGTTGKVASNGSDKMTEVNMVIWGNDARKASYEKLLAPLEKQGIKVNVTLVALEDIVNKTSTQIAAADPYDIVWMSEAMIPQFMSTNNLEDVSAIMNDKDYDFKDLSQSVCANYIKDGKLYAVPFTSSPRVWFYNKDMIKAAGLEDPLTLAKDGKWTNDKLIEYSRALSNSKTGNYGFSIWNYQSPNDWNILLDWTWSMGASFFNKDMTECTINTKEGKDSLQKYYDCIKEGLTPSASSQLDFASGKIGFSRNTISYKASLKDVSFKWDILPNPTGSDTKAPVAVGVAAYVVPKGAKHINESMIVIKYLTSKEQMSGDFLMTNFSPLRTSILSSDAYLNQGVAPTAEALKLAILEPMKGNTRLYPTSDNYNAADLKMKELLSSWYGRDIKTTDELCKSMESELNAILKK